MALKDDTIDNRRSVQRGRGGRGLLLALLLCACGNAQGVSTGGGHAGTDGINPIGGATGLNLGGTSAGNASAGAASGTAGDPTGMQTGGTGGSGVDAAGAGSSGTGTSNAGSNSGGAASAGEAGALAAGTGGSHAGSAGSSGASAAFDGTAVQALMRRVADYEIARFGTNNDNGWVRAVFHTGLLAAYRALGDAKYRDYTTAWGQANVWRLHADANGLRFADNQACVQSYAELYLADPVAQNGVMIAAAQTTFDAMVAAPLAGRTEWWWCDALFMAPGALARAAQATGKSSYISLMNTMFWDSKAFLYDPAQSLFWRDSTFLNTNTYWARGNGWVFAGLARILEVLPATDARRADYETLMNQMATKLRSVQAADGFWRSSLTQPNAFTTPESSGTAFFCYGMAWGIHHGVLDRGTYLPTVTKAWAALGSAITAQGRLGWVQAVGAQPGPSTMDSTNDYATGAFLLAGSEILKL
jgi:unsaturated rhamnogalacturonyl hydrolase